MAYSLGEAARAAGVSKTSIRRSIDSGRISATKDEFGRWQIEPAELHRIYPPAGSVTRPSEERLVPLEPSVTSALEREVTLLREMLERETSKALLEREREAVQRERQAVEREKEINRQLHADLERERADRDRDHALFRELAEQWKRQLPPPDTAPEPTNRPWWRFWR